MFKMIAEKFLEGIILCIAILIAAFCIFQSIKWWKHDNERLDLYRETKECEYSFDPEKCNEKKICELKGGFVFSNECLFAPK